MNSGRRSSVSPSSPSTPFVVGVFGCCIRRGWVAKSARLGCEIGLDLWVLLQKLGMVFVQMGTRIVT
ncbi:unnamed protein product [Arabidopsis halleri]